ncbi:MAG: CYCXC family (seleno)protein [Acidobacteriota bacterium]
MSKKPFLIGLLVLGTLALGLVYRANRGPSHTHEMATAESSMSHTSNSPSPAPAKHRIPAYQSVKESRSLALTLNPAQFVGKPRDAYQAAREIPATLAQLPCYCECDKTFRHKSLQTCFVDDHASHCAVCVDEALLAYRLQKELNKTPEQVREIIIEKYSAGL